VRYSEHENGRCDRQTTSFASRHHRSRQGASATVMIRTEHLSRNYGDKKALDDLDLRVEPGEILGYLGPNGAGKSTTVKILTGLIRPSSGRAIVAGFDVAEKPLEVKRRIGYVPETAALYDALTAAEYLDMVACLHHLDPKTAASRRSELLELFGLGDVQNQRMTEYSKGMRQKIVMAAALLHRPEVLFLDEPFDGLDANAAAIAKELLKRLASQGRTILFCSHILEVVERVCSRIVIINEGRQIAEGTPDAIRRAAGVDSLEEAFSRLTGLRDVGQVASELLAALDRT
jgi:ABC-2 type transport system ATP-binding protein